MARRVEECAPGEIRIFDFGAFVDVINSLEETAGFMNRASSMRPLRYLEFGRFRSFCGCSRLSCTFPLQPGWHRICAEVLVLLGGSRTGALLLELDKPGCESPTTRSGDGSPWIDFAIGGFLTG